MTARLDGLGTAVENSAYVWKTIYVLSEKWVTVKGLRTRSGRVMVSLYLALERLWQHSYMVIMGPGSKRISVLSVIFMAWFEDMEEKKKDRRIMGNRFFVQSPSLVT